jgi:hypothetical protein
MSQSREFSRRSIVGNMLAVLDTDLVMKVDLCTLTADMENAEQGQASNLKVAIPGRVW